MKRCDRLLLSADGQPTIQVAQKPIIAVTSLKASSETEALRLANEEARRPFDLSHGPLLRCVVISLGTDDHLLVINVHHTVSDGWSSGNFVARSQ